MCVFNGRPGLRFWFGGVVLVLFFAAEIPVAVAVTSIDPFRSRRLNFPSNRIESNPSRGMIQDQSIPQELLSHAKGLAFLTVIKGWVSVVVYFAQRIAVRR